MKKVLRRPNPLPLFYVMKAPIMVETYRGEKIFL